MAEARDTVFVGKSDQTPKPHMPRRDFLNVVGSIGAPLAASKILHREGMGFNETTIPQRILSGIGQIDFREQVPFGQRPDVKFGTAHVYLETATDLVVITSDQVSKGIQFWREININFPYGQTNRAIEVDARIDAPGIMNPKHTPVDWYIRDFSKVFDAKQGIRNPLRTLFIAKPKGFEGRVVPNDYLLQAAPDPRVGEKFISGGYPASKRGVLTQSELTYNRMTSSNEYPDAGMPLMEFSGVSSPGMEGAAIFRGDGMVSAIIWDITKDGKILGLPFAKCQPIDHVLKILKR